jgi:hypothetical protein
VQSESDDTPVLFEDLGFPRLTEVAQNGKLNMRILTCMNEGIAVACGRCTSLDEGTASVELAGRAENATARKTQHVRAREYGEAGCRCEMPPKGEAVHELETTCRCKISQTRAHAGVGTRHYVRVGANLENHYKRT